MNNPETGTGDPAPAIDWTSVTSSLFGGIALFLYGMRLLESCLVKIAGKRLRNILSLLSSNKFVGLIFGLVATALLQSSTITTVMLVSSNPSSHFVLHVTFCINTL